MTKLRAVVVVVVVVAVAATAATTKMRGASYRLHFIFMVT
jgi:hypothetical protein